MEELLFVKPKIEYKSPILEYKQEFIENSEYGWISRLTRYG